MPMTVLAVPIQPVAVRASHPPQAVIEPAPLETAARSATGEISVGLALPDVASPPAALPVAPSPSAIPSSTPSSAGTPVVPSPSVAASAAHRPLPLPWAAQPF